MTAPRVLAALVRLYPGAFRERWGADLLAEAAPAGVRAWPNLLAGAADAWLHPAVWPAGSPVQRRGRGAAMAVLVTVACWLTAHLTTEPGARGFAFALNGCALLLCLGLLLITPLPRPAALGALAATAIRRLALPVLMAAAAVLLANTLTHPVGTPLRVLVLGLWWGSWALGVIQGCRIIANLDTDVVRPAGAARARAGIGVLTASAGLAALTTFGFAVLVGRPGPLAIAAMLLVATVTAGLTFRDLAPAR